MTTRTYLRNCLKYTIGLPILILAATIGIACGVYQFLVENDTEAFGAIIEFLKPFKD